MRWAIFAALWLSAGSASAEQFGLFTYRVTGDEIEITDYPTTEVGAVEIPREIDGKPVTQIGESAFANCSTLTGIIIPEDVISIRDYAFLGCSGLTSVTILEGVTSIDRYAFYGCSGLASVTIPEGVTSIGDYAFSNCSGLTSVSIPDSVTVIGNWAFSACSGLTSITIPDSVTVIGNSAFYGCRRLTSIAVVPGNLNYVSVDGVLFDAEMTSLLKFPEGRAGSYTIPESVVFILGAAFSGCIGLTSILVMPGNPNYVSTDGVLFDAEMTSLLKFPEGKAGAYSIPEGITTLSEFAFSGCSRLTSVSIPESVTTISEFAFSRCGGLTSVFIPESVTSIGSGAFSRCSELANISIPEGVANIAPFTFDRCSGLTSITIPGRVTSIGQYAFSGCSSLTAITIPEEITSIGGSSFRDCTSLHSAIFLGDAPSQLEGSPFTNTAPAFTIYYLSSSTGFTSPTWNGYPSVMLDAVPQGSDLWLLASGLPAGTDLGQDLNGDGVSLLLAYALDLNPNLNLSGSLPAPVKVEDTVSMSFYAAAEGVTYRAEASSDLTAWTTEGVTLSEILPGGQRTATVSLDGGERFMRLVVAESE